MNKDRKTTGEFMSVLVRLTLTLIFPVASENMVLQKAVSKYGQWL